MAINRNDDYEKLAKLLYPSIEASGNTYYGQTRKLTLDEVFNKNNGGFESHIESVRVDNPSADYGFTYDTLLCWKVGPLNGTLKVDVEYNIGTYFAIYEIISEPVTNINQLNSGEFNTYEYNTSCEFKEVKETNGKSPVNNTDVYDGRNFYIYKDGIKNYIAVTVNVEVEIPYDENNPLKLTAINGEVTVELQCVGTVQDWPKAVRQESYECKSPASQDQWVNFTLGTDSVVLQPGESAYFRIKYCAAKPFSINKYINFVFTTGNGGKIQANGDIRSMQFDKTEMSPYEFINLFKECDLLIKAPDLYAYTASNYCYNNMFANCTALKSPPGLELRTVAESCCGYMFYACSLLKSTPIIKVVDFSNSESCFEWMFQECSSLKNVTCYNIANGDDQTVGWLNNISLSGIFKTLSDTQWELDSDSGIPENWVRVNIEVEPTNYETDKKLIDVLITSGSNSAENGRGDITTSDTLSNMENSFDENETHQMNIYNADGSFNQEIWGYKCFNSPVQFNNGIYGEQAKLVTTCEVKDNILDSYSEHIENIGSKLSSYTNANNISSNVTVLNTRTTVSNDDDLVVRNELGTCTSLVAGSVDYINIFNNSVNGTIIAASYNNIKKYDSDYDEYYYSEESDIILKAKSNSSYYSTIRINSSEEQEPENLIHETYIKLESNDINNGNKSYINIKPNNIYLHSSCLNIGDYNDSFKINIENYNIQTKCNILPNFNEIYNLGSDTKKWENIYCKYIHADNITVTIPDTLTCDCILPKQNGVYRSVGTSNNRWPWIYTTSVDVNAFINTPHIKFNSDDYCYINKDINSNSLVVSNVRDIKVESVGSTGTGNITLITGDSSNGYGGNINLTSGIDINIASSGKTSVLSTDSLTVSSSDNVSINSDKAISIVSGNNNYLYLDSDTNICPNRTLYFESGSYIQAGITIRNPLEFINATYLSDYIIENNVLSLKPGTIVLLYLHCKLTGSTAMQELFPGDELTVGNSQNYDIYTCCLNNIKDTVGTVQFRQGSRSIKAGTKVRLMSEARFVYDNDDNTFGNAMALAQVIQ